jgi:TPP-dependent pyruvate/acetoin dehydrogenase alpha subunit
MKRYPPFDPPEYLSFEADTEIVAAFRERVRADAERSRIVDALDEAALLALYAGMLRNRLHDLALKRWVRQGVISKAWLGTGEEAVTIGSVHALDRTRDVVAPMIRNQGACHEMGMSVADLLRGYLATGDGPNGGRDGHVGDLRHGVIQPISHVGQMVPIMTGAALAFRYRGTPRVALTWVGDGSTKTAVFHEGLNLAGVLKVPAIFIIQNNQVALGTALEQHQGGDFRDWPAMYGVRGAWVDGNNVLDVYAATKSAADHARSGGGPTLMVADTFRMGGHATHDEAEARKMVSRELFEHWGKRDPIGVFEAYLIEEGIGVAKLSEVEADVTKEVETATEEALASREGGLPDGSTAEFDGFSAGVRQPGLAFRIAARAG